ncbi:MAG: type II secretion system protein [Patescibacteria group bacterium]
MNKKAFTLLEIILVVAVLGLILTVVSLALFSKQAGIRDTKRLSDMKALRDAMQVVKNEKGSFEPVLCPLTSVNLCAQVGNSELLKYMTDLANLRDPKNVSIPCSVANCGKDACNYSFVSILPDEFQVMFYLEKGAPEIGGAGCYLLTEKGFKKQ